MSTTKKNQTTTKQQQPKSPSLPWLVEYWASSIVSKPMIHDLLLCGGPSSMMMMSCTGDASMDETLNDFSTTTSRLRQVVASHEDNESMDMMMSDYDYDARYPSKSAYPSIRKSSILYEDDEDSKELAKQRDSLLDKSLYEVEEEEDDTDDTRDGAPSSFMEDASSRVLYTCESFDQFLRGKTSDESAVRLQPRAEVATRQRLQPPASPSAQTYTTVSCSTSYMNDLDASHCDDSEEEEEDPQAVLERWTQASHELFRGMDGVEVDSSERDDVYSTPKQSRKRPMISPPHYKRKKISSPHEDKHEAFQYLIRMKPQNYVHDFSERSSGAWEEEKKEDDFDKFDLPSHLQLQSDMTFEEAFFSTPPQMPEF